MENKPFIHLLKTPLNKYVFDVNTNQMIHVSDELFDYLTRVNNSDNQKNVEESAYVKKQIDFLISQGYLSSKHPQKMRHNQTDLLEYHLNDNIAQIILQVTQQCNFRCSYCPYTTAKFDNQREHSSKIMSWDIAKSSVDFFAEHSSNQQDVCVGFYGGEPLLQYELIKKTVKYAENIFKGKNLVFTITTNGSLFTKENIQFLSEHNFGIMISLDGPPEIHNRSRKFASNGKGTFSSIEKNIEMLKELSPDLFRKITFNVVLDPRYSCNDIHDMFKENKMFFKSNIQCTLIDDFFSVEHVVPSENYIIEQNIHDFKAYQSVLGKYPKGNVSKVSYNNLISDIDRVEKAMIPQKTLFDVMSHSGPCIPGQRRLFIDVEGNLFPCERVSETSNAMNIGNLKDGFNFSNARKLLNICELTEKQCINCFALRHCTLCAKFCDNNGELSADLKRSSCKDVRLTTEETFKKYLMWKELKRKVE